MEQTRDRDRLRALLRRDPALHVYALGDLDDFFFPATTWWVSGHAVALVYSPPGGHVLAALAGPAERAELAALVASIDLPPRVYGHLSPGIADALARRYAIRSHGLHWKLARTAPAARAIDTSAVVPLGPEHAGELAAFYARAYPGNSFDARMLETGCFVAIRRAGAIAAVAGVHVVSPVERVAALGSIATAPEHRGRGLAAQVTEALCARLAPSVDLIGLNVRADNEAALRCYRGLGFTEVARYDEVELERTS